MGQRRDDMGQRRHNLGRLKIMPSSIDPQYPAAGNATTQSVRENFQYAKEEIEALQSQDETTVADVATLYATDNMLLDWLYALDREDVTPLPVLPPALRRVLNAANCTALANLTCAANRVYWIPFRFRSGYYANTVYIEVVTAAAGSGYLAIYDNETANGYDEPGYLNLESGDVADMSTQGEKAFGLNTSFTPNTLYWLAFKSTSAAIIRGLPIAANANPLGHVPGGNNACSHFLRSYNAGTMPDPAEYTTNGTGTVPALFFEGGY